MPVLCVEGALAVGKTTTANLLSRQTGAYIVPEMNRLFRPDNPDDPHRRPFSEFVAQQPPDWYLLRQAERWTMAEEASRRLGLAVLDRDPFQPLWYRWAFDYEGGGQTPDDLSAFYRPRIATGMLRFPDFYFLLTASSAELERRKEGDTTRDRRGFERQKRFIEPQKRYFATMKQYDEGRVHVLDTSSPEDNVRFIRNVLSEDTSSHKRKDDLVLFDEITDWLSQNPAHC